MLTICFFVLFSLSFANSASIAPFISNGNEAEITEFPFLVSFQYVDVHICGGSLLSERWILSSARCFVTPPIEQLAVEYGHTEIEPGLFGPNKSALRQIISHHWFNQSSLINDIALVEPYLSLTTGFHEPFVKLAIPGGARLQSGTRSVHAGWGHIQQNNRTTKLHKANINILSFDECYEAAIDTQKPNADVNICAKADSVLCVGDLGKICCFNKIK
jgi:secreted trypsin-like serine protease